MTGRQHVARFLRVLVVVGTVAVMSACVDDGAASPPTMSVADVSTDAETTGTVTTEVTEVDVATTLDGGGGDTATTNTGGTVVVTTTEPAVTVGGKGATATATVTLTAIPAGEGPTGGPGRVGAVAIAGVGVTLVVVAVVGAMGRARRH